MLSILQMCQFLAAEGAESDIDIEDLTKKVGETASNIKETSTKAANDTATWLEKALPVVIKFGLLIFASIIVYVIGKKIISWVIKLLKRSLQRSNVDEGVSKFLISLCRAFLYVVLLITIVSILGIPTSSFVAIVGSAGVTIGLALQGSLSNFAGGILILLLKPFRVGDYIVAMGNEGVVQGIDIFYTKLLTTDNRLIVIPNGALSNSNLVNVTNEEIRRLDLVIEVSYDSDLKKVKDVLYKTASENEMVLLEEHPIDVYVSSFESSSIAIGLRMWVETENYFKLKWEMLETIKERFDKEQIEIPFNQLDVTVKK